MLTHEGLIKTVLIIGGGVSSVDIAKDMTTARHIYQNTRGGSFDLDPRMLPTNASRVNEVVSFQLDDCDSTPPCDDEPLPVSAIMSSGEALHGIDIILVCTGYHISLPFLREYHNDDISLEDADDNILVTDGTQVHNLHKVIFYIPDPTLAFVGLRFYTFTHSVFDLQAITVAHVLSGVIDLQKRPT
jgi:ACS family pantothenate transporter-like MFS transporter